MGQEVLEPLLGPRSVSATTVSHVTRVRHRQVQIFHSRLKNRGLEGRALQMAVVDGNKGLWNALDLVWPGLPRQRCWAHKLRNVANHIPKRFQPQAMAQTKDIYAADSYGMAVRAFRLWKVNSFKI